MGHTYSIDKDLPAQAGKRFVITGANAGLGFEVALGLVKKGASVVLACRSVERGAAARDDIVAKSGAKPEDVVLVQLDVSDLENVRGFIARYNEAVPDASRAIDGLICNAGIMTPATRQLSKQGYELQWATNVFGHFLLVSELLPLLRKSSDARIVTVSSIAQFQVMSPDLNEPTRGPGPYSRGKQKVYGDTKLADLLLSKKLGRLFEEKGVTNVKALAAHPGFTHTALQNGTMYEIPVKIVGMPQERGAACIAFAATDAGAQNGSLAGPDSLTQMFGNPKWGCLENPKAHDKQTQDAVFDLCEKVTGAKMVDKLS